ncbi:MAG: delta-60 repeat domain-containing protein [Gaiellaceae bacterium]
MFVGVVLAAVLLVLPAGAASGDLDLTFGTGGKVTTDFASGADFALGVAIQSDGKIVAAGNTSPVGGVGVDFALARYNLDGSLDASFGSGGRVTTDFGSRIDAAAAVAVQPDGRIVAVGISADDFALARYNPDGSLDASFGSGGKVTTDFGGRDQGNAVAIQADGKIVAAGMGAKIEAPGLGIGDLALARYHRDGSLDASFGIGGKRTTEFGLGDIAYELALQADGKIVAAGRASAPGGSNFALARYNLDGGLDPTFGSRGQVSTAFGSGFFPIFTVAYGVALQADDKIVAAGEAVAINATGTSTEKADFALARYNVDGSLDPTFGGGGKVTTDLGGLGGSDTANAVVVQADGKIVAAGRTDPGDFALVRYNPDGSLDASFGGGGRVTTDFGSATDDAFDVAIQADGRIVAAGPTFGPGFADFAVARYQSGGALTVSIDIKPRSSSNPINLSSRGVVPVAILTTDGFDATTVDPSSVCFGDDDNARERDCTEAHGKGHVADVNGDGRPDLMLHYEVGQAGIDPGDPTACLTGTTFAGGSIEGCDSIRTL